MFTTALCLSLFVTAADTETSTSDGLKKLNSLVGEWKGTGTTEERQKTFWTEMLRWEWRFKGDDAWLTAKFEDGKYFAEGTLRHLPKTDRYEFTLTSPGKEKHTYTGELTEVRGRSPTLTLDRVDSGTKVTERLVITLLHSNRFLYRFETKADGSGIFTKAYQVGATKQGVPFASAKRGPECIVSGGAGTIKVSYKGTDYFVCCSGCKDAFLEDPERFIADAKKPKD